MTKNLTSIKDLNYSDIMEIIECANEFKKNARFKNNYRPLHGKSIVNNFPTSSLRTRLTAELAVHQLGAQAINIPLNFQGKESIEDLVGYLGNWIDALIIRYPEQEIIEKVAKLAKFPVINAMSSKYHPFAILLDIMTIQGLRNNLKELKFVFIGEGYNICNTWFEMAAKLDLNITQICPSGFEVEEEIYRYAKKNSKGEVLITNDLEIGIKGADIISTDVWPQVDNAEQIFKPYQITLELLKKANKNCIVNPCPPFKRGNEIEDKVIESEHFLGYEGKENLLYLQKAVLTKFI